MDEVNVIGFIQAAIRMSTPILLAGLGGLFTSRVGIINFALEGIMVTGAFFGVFGSYISGSPWIGALFGMIGGMAAALILGFMSITVKVDQVVSGTGINILFLGLTSYLLNIVFDIGAKPSQVASFQDIPILSQIPFIGPILFNQNALVYIAMLFVPFCYYVIYKTSFGLTLRAVGEHPRAADSLGISVVKTRYIAVVISGLLGGLGGAFLSIAQLSVFMENMTAGRGYVAWASVTVGNWNPFGILGASLLFGLADALQLRLQAFGIGIPHQFFMMLPYVLTMLVLAGVVGRTVGPSAMGKPYSSESK
ncbi:ABC transporter permease [Sporomusa sp. KB1]|jgi:simple sugar transport system permease protein|uniref:ABC transporter permease n=1 Tax=Sporomusa sp. KB1 TaxID=943346 RepID=UPI00119CB837|nr:ABC transporter permease [Sporomusa sp. KB1]TWH52058.1 simple sugar transport system permease protein [Sporomusa sp. KB1]